MSERLDWLDDLDLDPTTSWRRMGTRALGDRPWLVADDRNRPERALRTRLLAERRADVYVAPPHHVGEEVLQLVRDAGVDEIAEGDDPLAMAGLAVQEDLCLLQQRDGTWHLDAAMLCFPSRWRLRDKVGRPLVDVHAPTPGYEEHLSRRVDRLLDSLRDRPILRRNWFVHPDPSLHQPARPVADPIVTADRAFDGLHLRSERQTLRKLRCDWALFTIRIQHEPLSGAFAVDGFRERFSRYVTAAASDDLTHRGMAPAQVDELCVALGVPRRALDERESGVAPEI